MNKINFCKKCLEPRVFSNMLASTYVVLVHRLSSCYTAPASYFSDSKHVESFQCNSYSDHLVLISL